MNTVPPIPERLIMFEDHEAKMRALLNEPEPPPFRRRQTFIDAEARGFAAGQRRAIEALRDPDAYVKWQQQARVPLGIWLSITARHHIAAFLTDVAEQTPTQSDEETTT